MKLHRIFLSLGMIGIYGMITNNSQVDSFAYWASFIITSVGFGYYCVTD